MQNPHMIKELLQKLGLNETQITVYLALLSIGAAPASILGKRTDIPRSTTTYTCQQLEQKGLVTTNRKESGTVYIAKDPTALYNLLEKEYRSIEEKENQLERLIGDLKGLFNPNLNLPKVTFHEGVKSLISMFDDVLKDSQKIYGALRINDEIHPEILKYLNTIYTPQRSKLKNQARMLFADNEKTREYRKSDSKVNRISLLLPEKEYPFDSCFHIYGNKVAFYSYHKNDLSGVIIENSKIAATQFSIFKLAWNQALQLKANTIYRDTIL